MTPSEFKVNSMYLQRTINIAYVLYRTSTRRILFTYILYCNAV